MRALQFLAILWLVDTLEPQAQAPIHLVGVHLRKQRRAAAAAAAAQTSAAPQPQPQTIELPPGDSGEPNWLPNEVHSAAALQSDTHKIAIPVRGPPASGYKIGIVIVWMGDLPSYVNYFVASCNRSAALVDVIIFTDADFRTQVDSRAIPANVHFMPLTARQLAERAAPFLSDAQECKQHQNRGGLASHLEGLITADGAVGSKVNDFKPLFGALFKEELKTYSHWGWMDMDIVLGDLDGAITRYLGEYDVVTFPDGQLSAIFTAGQLSIFRNIEYFRRFFDVPYTMPDHDTESIPEHKLNLLCYKDNHIWDEQFTIWHVTRHPLVTAVAIMSGQFSGSASPWQQHFIVREDGRLVRPMDRLDAMKESGGSGEVVDSLKGMEEEHGCVPWYISGWSWVCLSTPVDHYQLLAWDGRRMHATALPVRKIADPKVTGGFVVEGAFFHMHLWKTAPVWMVHDTGWQHWGKRRIDVALRDKEDVAARKPCCEGLRADHGGMYAGYAQDTAVSRSNLLVGYVGVVNHLVKEWAVMWIAEGGWDGGAGVLGKPGEQ
jgi:hypothetical protein